MDWYVGNEWKLEKKGLSKKVLSIHFKKLEKPTETSKVKLTFEGLQNLNGRPAEHLASEKLNTKQVLQMGFARTPVDIYVERLVQHMLPGEKSRCIIKPKNGGADIVFIITLHDILTSKDLYTMSVKEIYDLAQQYKENGVFLFKEHTQFAHECFVRAAKLLISYKPFNNLTKADDGVDAKDIESLFFQIQTNIAACLLPEQRFEHVIYTTQFVEDKSGGSEKSIYRRARAFYEMNEFENAIKTMENLPNYSEKRDFAKLHAKIMERWKISNDKYKTVVQRMFS